MASWLTIQTLPGLGHSSYSRPLSSELRTTTPVNATFWPCLEQFSVRKTLNPFKQFPLRSEADLLHDDVYMKRDINQNVSGNDSHYTAGSSLVALKKSCSKLHCQKRFNLILLPCKIRSIADLLRGEVARTWPRRGSSPVPFAPPGRCPQRRPGPRQRCQGLLLRAVA